MQLVLTCSTILIDKSVKICELGGTHFMMLTTKTCLLDDENDGASDDSDGKVGEVRFVPEDKSACKIQKLITNFYNEEN